MADDATQDTESIGGFAVAWCNIPPPEERGIGPVRCPRCRKPVPDAAPGLRTCPHCNARESRMVRVTNGMNDQAAEIEELASEVAALKARLEGFERTMLPLAEVP